MFGASVAFSATPPVAPSPHPNPLADAGKKEALSGDDVSTVVQSHRSKIKSTCWAPPRDRDANVTVSITVAPKGNVLEASGSGDNIAVAECVTKLARAWI